jgi:Short C-terminal domain
MARTAVVAGTATAVSNRVSRRQANKWAQQGDPYQPRTPAYQYEGSQAPQQQYAEPPPPPPPAAAPTGEDRVQALKDLAALKEQGVLTDVEFSAEKARILGS